MCFVLAYALPWETNLINQFALRNKYIRRNMDKRVYVSFKKIKDKVDCDFMSSIF